MLEKNLKDVFDLVKDGNDYGEPITVVGATKTMSVETINKAIELGLKVVAENKVQEFNLKHEHIIGAEQHFIGHLQTNKVKYLVGKVKLIQSVDSLHLAEEIDKTAKKKDVIQDILIEVNIGGELSKSGFNKENAFNNALLICKKYQNLRVKGLMAMLPHVDDQNLLVSLCKDMRKIYNDLKAKGLPMEHLSVGMSNDYKVAIKNGSNMIRLGRTIFGERNYGEIK